MVAGAHESVIAISTRTIADLEEERTTSIQYERYMPGRIRMMAERDSVTEELFIDDNVNSDSLGETEHV